MSKSTASAQTAAAQAAMSLVTTFPDLPAAGISLHRVIPDGAVCMRVWGVGLALHDGLGDFEQWREALGFDAARVTLGEADSGTSWLEVTGTWAGVPVQVIGYFRWPDAGFKL